MIPKEVITSLLIAGTSIISIFLTKYFSKDKDYIEMFAEMQTSLYKEIARLSIKVEALEKKEQIALQQEKELNSRIKTLETDNEILLEKVESLQKELSKYVQAK